MDNMFFLVLVLLALGFLLPYLIFLMRNLRGILPYLYVVARVRAKEARLLKPDVIDEMVNSDSVAQIASILENSDYALAAQGLVLEDAEAIEDVLVRQTADVYSEIAKMLPGNVAGVFSFLQQQWDVRNLKTILRGIRKGLAAEEIMARIVPFGQLQPDTLKKMAEANSLEDLLPLFEGTVYAPLSALLPAYEQGKSLLPLESLLDKLILEAMWNRVTADRQLADLQPSFAARIDALNYSILFRAKKDHLLLSDIEPFLINGGELRKAVVNVFDEVDQIETLIAELDGTIYYKPLMDVLPDYEKSGSLSLFEKVLEEAALSVSRQTAVKQPYGIAPILGYLSLKETEMRTVRAIARAKEAGLSPEKIREFVVRV